MVPETYTVQQTAKLLHCSARTVYDRIAAKSLKAVRPCGGRWLVLVEPLEREFGVQASTTTDRAAVQRQREAAARRGIELPESALLV